MLEYLRLFVFTVTFALFLVADPSIPTSSYLDKERDTPQSSIRRSDSVTSDTPLAAGFQRFGTVIRAVIRQMQSSVSYVLGSPAWAAGPSGPELEKCNRETIEALLKKGQLPDHYRPPDWYLERCPMDRFEPGGKLIKPLKPGDICRGTALGGGPFANDGRNGSQLLPCGNGVKYFEADISPYSCGIIKGGLDRGERGKQRLVYDNRGNVYVTDNHYNTFYKATLVDGKLVLTPQAPTTACAPRSATVPKTGPVCGNGGAMRCMANHPQGQAFALQLGTCAIDDIERGGWNNRCKIYFDNQEGITLAGQAACEQWTKDPGSLESCVKLALGKTADAFTLFPGAGPFCGEIFDTAFTAPDRIGECLTGSSNPKPRATPMPVKKSREWWNDSPKKDSSAWNMGSHCGQGDGVRELVRDQGELYFTYTPRYETCQQCCEGESFSDGTKLSDPTAILQCAYRCMKRCEEIWRDDDKKRSCWMSKEWPWGRYEDVSEDRGDFSGNDSGAGIDGDF